MTDRDEAQRLALAVAPELRMAAQQVERLGLAIGDWLRNAALQDASLEQLQAADLVGQTLQELADFLDRYVAGAADGHSDPAGHSLTQVRLGALAARLRGETDGESAPPQRIELF